MDIEFGLIDNIMPKMMGKIYQMINLSEGYPDTPTLTESMTRPYKYSFIQAMTQDIKELKQHGTWNIVSRKSVHGTQIIPSSWAFKLNRFPCGIIRKLKAILCANDYRSVEVVYYFKSIPLFSLGLQ